ncbi:MAG: hypothetical protein AB1698_09870 [Pseudomonadota bacterium]
MKLGTLVKPGIIEFAAVAFLLSSLSSPAHAGENWKLETSRDDQGRVTTVASIRSTNNRMLLIVCNAGQAIELGYLTSKIALNQEAGSTTPLSIKVGSPPPDALSSTVYRTQSDVMFRAVLSEEKGWSTLARKLKLEPGPVTIFVDGETTIFPATFGAEPIKKVFEACSSSDPVPAASLMPPVSPPPPARPSTSDISKMAEFDRQETLSTPPDDLQKQLNQAAADREKYEAEKARRDAAEAKNAPPPVPQKSEEEKKKDAEIDGILILYYASYLQAQKCLEYGVGMNDTTFRAMTSWLKDQFASIDPQKKQKIWDIAKYSMTANKQLTRTDCRDILPYLSTYFPPAVLTPSIGSKAPF